MYATSLSTFGTVDTRDRIGVLLAYQPIYTRTKTVAAYQALLGTDRDDCTAALPDLASDTVLDAYTSIYQNERVETVPSILRVAPAMLATDAILALPKDRYIVEVAAYGDVPEGLADRLRTLAAAG